MFLPRHPSGSPELLLPPPPELCCPGIYNPGYQGRRGGDRRGQEGTGVSLCLAAPVGTSHHCPGPGIYDLGGKEKRREEKRREEKRREEKRREEKRREEKRREEKRREKRREEKREEKREERREKREERREKREERREKREERRRFLPGLGHRAWDFRALGFWSSGILEHQDF
ncbi:hypothetical protein HGM15179_015945 [Zosterops borbonicus]|uniref:Uncharacterized protein n=1 Tax=Zosterops borbonicus TaxID=364589 RepID=A0A8K1G3V7_9PASS|nr:hypothetical protein HGM15179_015945 [Zosterops borbonicus]